MQQRRGISQESLKLIACISMLIDHIGAALVYDMYQIAWENAMFQPQRFETIQYVYRALRIIGRISFPIYCFLLAEGAHHTRNPKKYGLRLLIGVALAEIPFDLALFGELTWEHQSVMVTLLLGFAAVRLAQRVKGAWKIIMIVPFCLLAELLNTDYGAMGVAMIALFALTRQMEHKTLWQLTGMAALCMTSGGIGGIEMYALFAMIPISFYCGRKRSYSKTIQWGFYLFYPLHLLVLWGISVTLL